MGNVISVPKLGEQAPPLSLEEKKALLEAYKLKNPTKYAVKEAAGEFSKFLGADESVKHAKHKEAN